MFPHNFPSKVPQGRFQIELVLILVHICPGRCAINLSIDFPCDFGGIVVGSGLRRMCSHCLQTSCDFLYGPSGGKPG